MSEKQRLDAQLAHTKQLLSQGHFAKAREQLSVIEADPDLSLLGQLTSLGIPRRVQSLQLKLAKAEKDILKTSAYQYHLVPPPELISQHTQLTSTDRQQIAALNQTPIPKIIHQIWIGHQPVPFGCKAWACHAKLHGYKHQLWDETALEALGITDNPVFKQMQTRGDIPGAVDVARYIILEKMGGIYLDCDWYPSRNDLSFQDFLPMRGLTAMAEPIPRYTGFDGLLLANSFIATPARHPVFYHLSKALPKVMESLPSGPAWWATGPLLFTFMARSASLCLADNSLVAGKLPQKSTQQAVQERCDIALQRDEGLLLAWKSWHWVGY